MESGVHIEFGPGRHGMGEQTYLYFREPGGNRIEVNSGGYRIYQPDWNLSGGYRLRVRTRCIAIYNSRLDDGVHAVRGCRGCAEPA